MSGALAGIVIERQKSEHARQHWGADYDRLQPPPVNQVAHVRALQRRGESLGTRAGGTSACGFNGGP